jgi:hypothetical protein
MKADKIGEGMVDIQNLMDVLDADDTIAICVAAQEVQTSARTLNGMETDQGRQFRQDLNQAAPREGELVQEAGLWNHGKQHSPIHHPAQYL